MTALCQDLRFGARNLLKNPGFTIVAVLALSLGIGANTAIFSLVDALLLRPIAAVADPGRLVQLGETYNHKGFSSLSYADLIDFRSQNSVFTGIAIHRKAALHLSTGNEAERVSGELVNGDYFPVLGVKAALGRTLQATDDGTTGASPVAVISHGLWRRRFAADPGIVGRSVSLNAHRYTIVGVAADGFNGITVGEPVDIWAPLNMYQDIDPELALLQINWHVNWLTRRGSTWLDAFARLKPGISIEQASAELGGIAARLAQAYPNSNENRGLALSAGIGLGPDVRQSIRSFSGMLMAAVVIVLLIACANVANLLMVRANARQKELGIRLALGASRGRIVRQLLTESVLLSGLGGLGGIAVAIWLGKLMLTLLPAKYLNVSFAVDLSLDRRVLGFGLAASLLTGIIFGLAPAVQASKPDLIPLLKDGGSSEGRPSQSRLRGAFVVTQVALSLVLLIGAGLFIRTLRNVRAIGAGFESENVLTAKIDLGRQNYSESQGQLFYRELQERLQNLPGVRSASMALLLPIGSGRYGTSYRFEGQPADSKSINISFNTVTSGYFATMKIPLMLGRDFTEGDNASAPRAAIINETMARQLWPDENPIGKKFTSVDQKAVKIEVIGVAKDVKYRTLFETTAPFIYFPLPQDYRPAMAIHVRTSIPSEQIIGAVNREVSGLDKSLPIYEIKTVTEQLDSTITPQRVAAMFISGFGLLALLLAVVGIYGVMSYTVGQRTREIGIRMAIGAQGRDILRLVLGQGLKLTILGLGVGLIVAFVLTRLLVSLLYGVSATDPLTFSLISMLLLAVALLAGYIPARRATRVDPNIALRYE